MCGITGFTHLGVVSAPEWIRSATSALAHRGPDDYGTFETDCISLGAVRLRIVDPQGGHQPLSTADRAYTLVFNGEIYNHSELREELLARGHRFHSRSDTETLLRAFVEWDTDCFSRLRGMFALAIWCERDRRLVLARDRVGIKPLYIARRGPNLYFGSELKALFAHPAIERRISHTGLHHFLSLNYVPCPHTLVEGIEKLGPGEFLEWREGHVRRSRYWSLYFEPDQARVAEDAAEELDQLLRSSVKEHLAADVPLGLWISGGVDSSTILHYAAEAGGAPLKTFSITFRGREFDEGEHARHIARRYGTEHHELDLNPDLDLNSVIENLAYYSDEPGADAGALPLWYLSELTRRHATVALTGDGADELFGGYVTYRADQYARHLRRVPAVARKLALAVARRVPVSDSKIGLDYKLTRLLSGSFLPASEAHLHWNGTFSEKEKERLLGHNGLPPVGKLLNGHSPGIGYLNGFLRMDQQYYLPDDILYKCDRMSMAHALEVRPPFLDHRIVEFAARLPERLKIRNGNLKFLLKHLMKERLGPEILDRPKEGFDIPAHHWLRGPLRSLLLDTLTRPAVEASGLFRWTEVETVLRDHLEKRANLGYHLWGLLTLFLWIKKWGIQSSSYELSEQQHAAP